MPNALSVAGLALGIVFLLTLPASTGSTVVASALHSSGPATSSPSRVTRHPTSTREVYVNLIGHSFVSKNLTYQGYHALNNKTSTKFPRLLTGNAAKKYWSSGASVLELSPAVNTGWSPHSAYTAGTALFKSNASASVTLSMITTSEPTLIGVGFENYLFVTPTNNTSWAMPYYATRPPVSYFLVHQGATIFPYSNTPYVVLQVDPSWKQSGCTAHCSEGPEFNLYLVSPSSTGAVSRASISALGCVGSSVGGYPAAGDYVKLSTAYSLSTGILTAQFLDMNNTSIVGHYRANLSSLGFAPNYTASGSYYFGFGGSGNWGPGGMGVVYADMVRR